MDSGNEDPISLTPEDRDFIQSQVQMGHFASASEVVREGLRQLRELDQYLHDHRDKLDALINEGLADIERGDVVDGEAFMDELDRLDREQVEQRRRKPA